MVDGHGACGPRHGLSGGYYYRESRFRRTLRLEVNGDGEPFGKLCFCRPDGPGRRGTAARAAADSDVVEVGYGDFVAYLQRHRPAMTALLVTFCVRLADPFTRHRARHARAARKPRRHGTGTRDVIMGRLRERGLVDYGRARPLAVDVAALQAFVEAR